jgi:copper resistance protein B
MRAAAFLAFVPGVVGMVALAQDPHAAHKHAPPAEPTQSTPAPAMTDEAHADHAQPPPAPATASPTEPDPHAGHQMPPNNEPHTSHAMPRGSEKSADQSTAASLPVGDASPPPVIKDNLSDKHYSASEMTRARNTLNSEHGGGLISKVMANIFELTTSSRDGGYRWNVDGRYGGDTHRFVFKSEGEAPGGDVESAELQGLYSRAVGRYTDVQAGIRYDLEPNGVAYAAVGVETLLPYWFDVEGSLFVSEHGDSFARLEGSYDFQFTQRLILQPRVELTLAAQDVPESSLGSGFSLAEIGLRLRYDIRREFSPYVGVNFEKRFGRTADLARASNAEVDNFGVVVGLRAWF